MLRLIRREGLIEAYEDRPVGRMVRAGLRNELRVTRHAYSQIACKDEIVCLPRAFPIRFVENAARASGAETFGFHVKVYQLTSWQRIDNHREWLARMQGRGWKIIYLWRDNLLRHVCLLYTSPSPRDG